MRGEPFEGSAYSWATDVSQRAIVNLQDAALEAARALRESGDLDAADRVIEQGIELMDPNGALYAEWAEVERMRGRHEQPQRIYTLYRQKLTDDTDDLDSTAAIPPEIEQAFHERMERP